MRLPAPITSRTNARVKALRAALSGEARQPGDLLGLEGPNLIREAHAAGMTLETVYLREGSAVRKAGSWYDSLRAGDWVVLSPEVFDSAVSTATPQGIAATWRIQQPQAMDETPNTLVLENLQDPGNLGTLLRSAQAFGFHAVMVTPETANAWNPKVMRAAAGAVFHLPIQRMPLETIVTSLRRNGVRLFAAVAGFLAGEVDGRQPVKSAPHGVLFGHRNNYEAESPRYQAGHQTDASERAAAATTGYRATSSYDADFDGRIALMIGNEGAGLSDAARAAADEQVSIPCGGTESLNAAVAGSILMYEAMRQLPLRQWARQQGLRP